MTRTFSRLPTDVRSSTCVRTRYQQQQQHGRAGGSFSGTAYDRWSYEQSTPGSNDTAINKLQHKYWVAKQVRRIAGCLLG